MNLESFRRCRSTVGIPPTHRGISPLVRIVKVDRSGRCITNESEDAETQFIGTEKLRNTLGLDNVVLHDICYQLIAAKLCPLLLRTENDRIKRTGYIETD